MHINETVIDMAGNGWNVNEEYERLFGAAKRVNLFDTEEEYNELRRFIMDQPQLTFVNPANYHISARLSPSEYHPTAH